MLNRGNPHPCEHRARFSREGKILGPRGHGLPTPGSMKGLGRGDTGSHHPGRRKSSASRAGCPENPRGCWGHRSRRSPISRHLPQLEAEGPELPGEAAAVARSGARGRSGGGLAGPAALPGGGGPGSARLLAGHPRRGRVTAAPVSAAAPGPGHVGGCPPAAPAGRRGGKGSGETAAAGGKAGAAEGRTALGAPCPRGKAGPAAESSATDHQGCTKSCRSTANLPLLLIALPLAQEHFPAARHSSRT